MQRYIIFKFLNSHQTLAFLIPYQLPRRSLTMRPRKARNPASSRAVPLEDPANFSNPGCLGVRRGGPSAKAPARKRYGNAVAGGRRGRHAGATGSRRFSFSPSYEGYIGWPVSNGRRGVTLLVRSRGHAHLPPPWPRSISNFPQRDGNA